MGADLILVAVPVPTYTNGDAVTAASDIESQLLDRITTALTANGGLRDYLYDGPLWSYSVEGTGEDEDLGQACLAAAATVIASIANWYRDLAVLTLDGKDWAFCGGTSWGDTPGECFDDYIVVAELGLFDTPFTKEA